MFPRNTVIFSANKIIVEQSIAQAFANADAAWGRNTPEKCRSRLARQECHLVSKITAKSGCIRCFKSQWITACFSRTYWSTPCHSKCSRTCDNASTGWTPGRPRMFPCDLTVCASRGIRSRRCILILVHRPHRNNRSSFPRLVAPEMYRSSCGTRSPLAIRVLGLKVKCIRYIHVLFATDKLNLTSSYLTDDSFPESLLCTS